jgi:hypothetical protein
MINNNIAYSAVVLDERSRQRLIERFKELIPKDWTIYADHQTINSGEIKPEYEKYLGMPIRLSVNDYAMNNKVIAVGVDGFYSDKNMSHITLAVNTNAGGKPSMSNELTDWKSLKRPLMITGKVIEVPYKIPA